MHCFARGALSSAQGQGARSGRRPLCPTGGPCAAATAHGGDPAGLSSSAHSQAVPGLLVGAWLCSPGLPFSCSPPARVSRTVLPSSTLGTRGVSGRWPLWDPTSPSQPAPQWGSTASCSCSCSLVVAVAFFYQGHSCIADCGRSLWEQSPPFPWLVLTAGD